MENEESYTSKCDALGLEEIGKHPIKTHTILVDYVHSFNIEVLNHVTIKSIMDKISAIGLRISGVFICGIKFCLR